MGPLDSRRLRQAGVHTADDRCTELPGGEHTILFDEAEIRDVFENDVDGILDLIALVSADLPKYAATLTAHVEREEWSETGRVAHTIKGAAANVFAADLAEAAQTVERAAKQGSTASIAEDTARLTAAVAALVQALDSWSERLAMKRDVA